MPIETTVVANFPATLVRPRGACVGTAVFLHGAFADHVPLGPWQERFAAAGWACVAPARRGRAGVGPANADGLRFEDYLADTRAVLDALGEPVLLVGHSLGGLIAQVMAAEGRALGVVLLTPAPPFMLSAQFAALPVYLPNLPKIMLGRPFVPPAGGCARIALNRMPEAERPAIHATLVPESGHVYREMMFGAIRVDPAKVKCPVVVVAGGEDRVISTSLARRTAEHYGAPLWLYPEHAHWILAEPGWEAICERCVAWSGALGTALDGAARAG